MNYHITVIGAVGVNSPYQPVDILRLLNTQPHSLLHGNTFTGRPGTQVYIEPDAVLKIRTEIRLEPIFAKRWVEQTLTKEQSYQIYHPDKTWFVAETTNQSTALIGSICPRLQPLHDLFTQDPVDILAAIDYFSQLFEHYFRLAKQMKVRLDEGLSNFGVSAEHKLFYLDDDIYTWDRFISAAQMLGVYFRSLTWIEPNVASRFGKMVRDLMVKHFHDTHDLIVLAELLKDVYMPTESHRQRLNSFIEPLISHQPVLSNHQLNQARYIAILADIHANFPALKVVLDFLNLKGIKTGIVLGDIVGYGPHPSQCIELLQQTQLSFLKGNHDHSLANNQFENSFSRPAIWALRWSSDRVSTTQKDWLANLPPLIYHDHWLAIHGAPVDPTFFNAYVYEMTYANNLDVLQRKNIPICFHGHIHKPGVYGRRHHQDQFIYEKVIDLKQFDHALICPGSVGQPRSQPLGAQFAIYDQQERQIHFHNLPYNLAATITDMENYGFPENLIDLLKRRFELR
jgi:predicted phosphodiesterase